MTALTLSHFKSYLIDSLFDINGRSSFSRFSELSKQNNENLVWYPCQPISISKPHNEKGQFNSLALIHKYLAQKKISSKHPLFPLWTYLNNTTLVSYFETYTLPTLTRTKLPTDKMMTLTQCQKLERYKFEEREIQYSYDMLSHFIKIFQMLESFATVLPEYNEEFKPITGYLKDNKGKNIDFHYLAKTLLFPDRKLAKKINEWQQWDPQKNTQKFYLDTSTNLSKSLLSLQEVKELSEISKAYVVVYCEAKTQKLFACSENPKYRKEEYFYHKEGDYTHKGRTLSQQAFIYSEQFKDVSSIYLDLAIAQKNVRIFLEEHPTAQYSIALYKYGELHSLAPLVSKGQKWVDSVNPLIEKNLLNKFTQSAEHHTVKTTQKI